MRNLLLTLCYDGAQYHGWQIQNNAVSVQQVFQEALFKVTSEKPEIKGCSRTDSGVHALSLIHISLAMAICHGQAAGSSLRQALLGRRS